MEPNYRAVPGFAVLLWSRGSASGCGHACLSAGLLEGMTGGQERLELRLGPLQVLNFRPRVCYLGKGVCDSCWFPGQIVLVAGPRANRAVSESTGR